MGHWIVDCMKLGSKIISVDPRHTWMTSRSAHHLQLRPGTSGALALGMLNVIIGEDLYDKEFVDKYTYGFDKLRERVKEYPVDKVAAITDIPAQTIVQASRMFASSKPAAVHWGVPVDMEPESTSVAHAIICLWTLTGSIDVPGGMVIARPSFGVTAYPWTTEELVKLYGEDLVKNLNEKRIGADKYPMVKNFRGLGPARHVHRSDQHGEAVPDQGHLDPDDQHARRSGGKRPPPLRCPEEARVHRHRGPLPQPDHHGPGRHRSCPPPPSRKRTASGRWWAPLQIIQKRVQVGECKTDWEINFEMAKRFNPEGLKKWDTVIDLFNERLAPSGMTFQDLQEKGGWVMPPDGPFKPYLRHERGLLRRDGKPGFSTATGKVELYCTKYEDWGLDPLPHYEEPMQSRTSTPELFKKYPLVMITGVRSQLFFHSEHRMIPWLREKEQDPFVEIHPETARKYGIYDGEWVYIKNDMGRVKRKAKLTRRVKPSEICTRHGWWMPEMKGPEPDLFGCWDYQINVLIPTPQQSSSGFGGGRYKTTLVTLEKISE